MVCLNYDCQIIVPVLVMLYVQHPETTLVHEPVTASSSLRARHLKEQLSIEFAVPVSIQAGCLPLLSPSIKLCLHAVPAWTLVSPVKTTGFNIIKGLNITKSILYKIL